MSIDALQLVGFPLPTDYHDLKIWLRLVAEGANRLAMVALASSAETSSPDADTTVGPGTDVVPLLGSFTNLVTAIESKALVQAEWEWELTTPGPVFLQIVVDDTIAREVKIEQQSAILLVEGNTAGRILTTFSSPLIECFPNGVKRIELKARTTGGAVASIKKETLMVIRTFPKEEAA